MALFLTQSCSLLVYNGYQQKINALESVTVSKQLENIESKKDVLLEFGPADSKQFENGFEFWTYTTIKSTMIAGNSQTSVTINDDIALGSSSYSPARIKEEEESIQFVFEGDDLIRYRTYNVNINEELNKQRKDLKDTQLFIGFWAGVWDITCVCLAIIFIS